MAMTVGDMVARGGVVLVALAFFGGGGFAEGRSGETPEPRASEPDSPDVQAIQALIADWIGLYNSGAYDALASAFYAEDAVLMSPYAPPRRGREAILHSFRADAELNDEHCDTSTIQGIRVSGNLAVAWGSDTGTTTPKRGGAADRYSLKWMMAFERRAGATWKCICEIWNENLIPAAGARTPPPKR